VVARLRRPATGWLLAFTVTLFLSSALLFAVQPMVAKMILPLLGGAPATWIASMLFFQTALLAGYAYAHGSTRWLGSRRQLVVHAVLLLLSLLALPIALPRGWTPDSAGDPVAWLLLLLIVTVGLPFFLVCSTGPLLQQWFTSTPHASAQDPYFLYRASNVGSMLALLAYPVLIEPRLRLADQGQLWAVAYLGLVALTFVCAVVRWRTPVHATAARERTAPERLTAARRLRWVVLAFVPSIFMLAVTTHITTDIAAVPLLWVIPLALYLLSFVVAFSPRPSILSALISQAQPFLILQLVLFIVLRVTEPVLLVLVANLLALFVSALVCHGRLAEDRPPSAQLTEFYLWIALGGALGGVFNAVVAPLLFDTVVEYPLAIVLACGLRRPRPARSEDEDRRRRLDTLLPLGVGVFYVTTVALGRAVGLDPFVARVPALLVAVVLCATFSARPVRFGLGVGAILVAAALPFWSANDTLYSERTFFGVLRVDRDEDHRLHRMVHGNTVHGAQSTEPGRRLEPLSYYTALGPVFDLPGTASTPEVAVIGLGTGSLACHGRLTQHWTFYEIDPAVERLARDPSLFTYLRDCPPKSDVVLGDARRSLSRIPGDRYGVIVVDAFNSDSIPVHLLTREALALYVDRLADGGVIALNVTNRYLDLSGVVGNLARDAHLASLVRDDLDITEAETDKGKSGSMWVVLARSPADLAPLATGAGWAPVANDPGSEVWTDDFSNLLSAFKRG
jgi:spermidine synthase